MKNVNDDFDRVANEILREWLTASNSVLENTVIEFNKVGNKDLASIKDFCVKYRYLPPKKLTKSFMESFQEEHVVVNKILSSISKKQLTQKNLDLINSKMTNVKRNLTAVSSKKLVKLNNEMGADSNFSEKKSVKIIVTYSGPTNELLWLHISQLIEQQTTVKDCKNCGGFFLHEKSKGNKLYCSETCQYQYRQRKHRSKVKKMSRVS